MRDSYIGGPVQSVIDDFGKPDKILLLDSGKVAYEYKKEEIDLGTGGGSVSCMKANGQAGLCTSPGRAGSYSVCMTAFKLNAYSLAEINSNTYVQAAASYGSLCSLPVPFFDHESFGKSGSD
jgi:hypothetical protein